MALPAAIPAAAAAVPKVYKWGTKGYKWLKQTLDARKKLKKAEQIKKARAAMKAAAKKGGPSTPSSKLVDKLLPTTGTVLKTGAKVAKKVLPKTGTVLKTGLKVADRATLPAALWWGGSKIKGMFSGDDEEEEVVDNFWDTSQREVTPWHHSNTAGSSENAGTVGDAAPPTTTKAGVLQQAKDRQAKLAGTDGPYGYEGGNDQRVRDTNLLKSTRLGMREPDKSFRLRTGDEIDARNREGQFAAERHKRGALKKFRRRFGNADNERKQFIKDTGMNPEATERMARAGEESVAAQKATQDRQKVLDKYRVKEPEPMTAEVAKKFEDTEENRKKMKKILGR